MPGADSLQALATFGKTSRGAARTPRVESPSFWRTDRTHRAAPSSLRLRLRLLAIRNFIVELTNTPARPAALKTLLCLATLAAAAGAHSTPTALAPLYAGSFAPGTGSDARFVQIDPNWHGSSVLWTEPVNVISLAITAAG